ncbi:hypothetical protein Taro_020044 [Colocasia esculenta]|uniref:DYW domain-containing protein n=1 Tax=Colocasia esculenta TaxID=4460 RepID=A0A843UVD3_COLES|nr:hypothetical protein [Colocasia esculenta]
MRRCAPAAVFRKTAASLAVGSFSAFFTSGGRLLPPDLGSALLPRERVGGLEILTLARRLVTAADAAEWAQAPEETRHGGFGSGGSQSEVWGTPHGRKPDGSSGDALGSALKNVGGFKHGNLGEALWTNREASALGSVVQGYPNGYHRGSPPSQGSGGHYGGFGMGNPAGTSGGAYLNGFSSQGQWSSDGFQRGATQDHGYGGPPNHQQNLSGYGGRNPVEAYPGNPNVSSMGKYNGNEWIPDNHGDKQLGQGTFGIPSPPLGEIQGNMGGNYDARPPDESTEAAGSNCFKGTVDELDGFLQESKAKEAVEVLHLLEKQGMILDLPRYLKLMDVCGDAKAVEEAKFVHGHILRTMGNPEVKVNNRILDMYCKCGSMDDAHEWFDKMPGRNFTSWDTMMMGFADNGLGEDAIDFFNRFLEMGLRPDGHTFIAVFHACSVLGAVDEGMLHFESMSKVYGISPTLEHYVSIVDMLGQTGYLDEAVEFIEMMPTEPNVDVWETLMNRCRLQGNVELGDRCAEIVEILNPSRLTKQSKDGLLPVKESDLAKEKAKKKENILEVRSRVHEYRAGDTSHPENDRIYGLIKGLAATLRDSGYVPDTRFVLHDIDQESKEEALLAHSERLATAYGFISSAVRSPIRIIKNLRICGDCHSYMKIVSKLVGRELIIRDAKRFHHFKDVVLMLLNTVYGITLGESKALMTPLGLDSRKSFV